MNSQRMTIPEYKTTTIEKQKFILSHYGLGKSCWDWLILIVSFYVAIVVPYNATFKEKRSRGGALMSGSPFQSAFDSEVANEASHLNSSSAYYQSQPPRHHDIVCKIDSIDIFVEVVFIIGEC